MKFLTASSLVLGALILGVSQTPARCFTLDAFTDFEGSNTFQSAATAKFDPSPTTVSDRDISLDSTVFGGQRTIQVTKNSGSTAGTIDLTIFDGDATLQSAVNGSTEIIWDGNDSSNTPTDITVDGATEQKSIELRIIEFNLGTGNSSINLNFEFKDTNNNVATITRTITEDINTSISLYFPYQNRVESTNDNGGDINLANVDYIRFYTSEENKGDDFTFNLIQTSEIPLKFSPTLGIIIGKIFIGFNVLKKRLKNQ